MNKINVALIIGSSRKDSFTKKIALALKELAPKDFNLNIVDISKLPFYEQDLKEANKEPNEWHVFRQQIKENEALLIVTPEYNRSFPAVIKNALDVGSRPYGKSVWNNKPGAIVGVSPGAIGGFGASNHLRQVLTFLNVPTMQQPEVYIGAVHTLLDAKGKLANESTKEFLSNFMNAFLAWVLKNK